MLPLLCSFQADTTNAVKCSVNLTETIARTDSIALKLITTGEACNFTVFYENSRSDITDCDLYGQYSNVYICDIRDLEPGTLHHFEVISKTDGERRNVSVRTGKLSVINQNSFLLYFNLFNGILF